MLLRKFSIYVLVLGVFWFIGATFCGASYLVALEEKLLGTHSGGCGFPSQAYNSMNNQYLVAYHWAVDYDNRGIDIKKASMALQPLGGQSIPGERLILPALVHNFRNNEYFLVYVEEYPRPEVASRIMGKIIKPIDLSAETVLIAESEDEGYTEPAVAFNSYRNEYMVVFERLGEGANNIRKRWLDQDGGYLSSVQVVKASERDQENPDIVYNLAIDQYLVVWQEKISDTNRDIKAARLGRDGATYGGAIDVIGGSEDQRQPAVITNEQDRYFVVWSETLAGDYDIKGQLFDLYGNHLYPRHLIVATAADEMVPDVAYNGVTDEYLVVWEEYSGSSYSIRANLYSGESRTALQEISVADQTATLYSSPAVSFHASDTKGFLVTYGKKPIFSGIMEIFGVMLQPLVPYIYPGADDILLYIPAIVGAAKSKSK